MRKRTRKTLSIAMSAVLVFGTCVPGGGVQALADDGADQPAASQGVADSTGEKDQNSSVARSEA